MPRSTFLKNAILDAIVNHIPLDVEAPYISLHTDDPGGTGANEVAGGSYVRKSASFGAVGAGTRSNDALVEWTGMPACTVTHMGIWDALAGNFIWDGELASPKVVNVGDTFQFPVGNLTLSEVDV